jgi:hypothetical protein
VTADAARSDYRVEKRRVTAVLTLSNGLAVPGSFFVAGGSQRHAGPERVGDVLNSDTGFFPFETGEPAGTQTVLLHRNHVVMVALTENEASGVPGYDVATLRNASLLLSSGQRVVGVVRVYRPEGHHRLSDWAYQGERFRYIETNEATVLINVDHVLEVREVTGQ